MIETKVHKRDRYDKSLRTVIPNDVVKQFNIKEGDILHWGFRASDNNKVEAVVIKSE